MTIYSLGSGKMVPLSTEGKNDLPLGTRLRTNGYGTDYIIVGNKGINPNYPDSGARYEIVNLATEDLRREDAVHLDWISDKKDERIATYIMGDEPWSGEDVKMLRDAALAKSVVVEDNRKRAEIEHAKKLAKGKELYLKLKPLWAKAVIVGYEEIDDCDIMTDYFNTKRGKTHVLAWSKHNRDLFPEMRKAAKHHPETVHLSVAPKVNENGNPKTDENKSWWHPFDEHREKWSMGAGFYLKGSHRYSTGWKVSKSPLAGWYMENVYLALAEGRASAAVMVPPRRVKDR